MKEEKAFVTIRITDLSYPIKIGVKSKMEGESTITTLSVEAEIEKQYESQVEDQVISIINDKSSYIGPTQLSKGIINYFKSLNARQLKIVFNYPFFLEQISPLSKQKHLMKYNCEFSVKKNTLDGYKKQYRIEIPVIIEQYFVPGIQKELLESPLKIVVEIEGNETFFVEDIIQLVERNILESNFNTDIAANNTNVKLKLLENVNNELVKKFDTEKCSVNIVSQKMLHTYSVQVSSKTKQIESKSEIEKELLFI